MNTRRIRNHPIAHSSAGFGLVDALVALALLAVTLLGACGSLHFALRATRSAAWQSRAIDLVADLDEDLQHTGPALPPAAQLESWRSRLRQELPAAGIAALDRRSLVVGELETTWLDLQLAWNGMPGEARDFLRLPLAHAVNPP